AHTPTDAHRFRLDSTVNKSKTPRPLFQQPFPPNLTPAPICMMTNKAGHTAASATTCTNPVYPARLIIHIMRKMGGGLALKVGAGGKNQRSESFTSTSVK